MIAKNGTRKTTNGIAWRRLDGAVESPALAQAASLRYVSDDEPGFRRRKNGRGFVFTDDKGRPVRHGRARQRIESLVIPPAWTDVWICRHEDGHLQVTGRDEQQRKQYIYHERWREVSNLVKFRRMLRFGALLPEIRKRVNHQLGVRTPARDRVCSLLLALLDQTAIRVGNEEYVQENGSYGLTTLRRRHISVNGSKICFRFRGKSGKLRCFELDDARLARLVLHCRNCPGQHLFTYPKEDGQYAPITSDDVNSYLRELTGEQFSAKDFRTWKASSIAAGMLYDRPDAHNPRERRMVINEVVKQASETLGNTTTVCRKYYIHPRLFEAYSEGSFTRYFDGFCPRPRKWLNRDEMLLLHFLEQA